MAPEVTMGKPYDARADIYSLGLTLYRLMNNNHLPFYPQTPLYTPAAKRSTIYTYKVPDGVETIGKNAFYSAEIKSVILPESIRIIEESAFMYSSLQSLSFPSNLQKIEEYAFFASYLNELIIPETIQYFDESAIGGCYYFRYFEMPACVTELTHVGALDADSPNGLVVLHDGIQFVAENTDAFPQRDYFSFEYGGPLFAIEDSSFVHEYLISRGYYPQYYILLGESLKHIPTPEERILDCQHEWIYRLIADGTAEVLGYCGPSESLMIPDELDGHPTTSFAIGYEDFSRALAVGVTAPFYLTKLLSPHFTPGASVINISSSRDRMSQPQTESYTAAKGGIAALNHVMAISLAGKARVNSISPGRIDTTGSSISSPDAMQQPVGRVGKPEDTAEMALFLCSDKAGFITDENICIDGGMTKLLIYHGEHGWEYRI